MNITEKIDKYLGEGRKHELYDLIKELERALRHRKDTNKPDSLGDKMSRMLGALQYVHGENTTSFKWDNKRVSIDDLKEMARDFLKQAKKE